MSHVEEGTLHAMLDGELTGEEAKSVKAHLDQCVQCRAAMDEARDFFSESDRLIESLDDDAAAASDGPARVAHARPWYRRPQFLAAAATITLAIGAGYLGMALRDSSLPSEQPGLLSEADATPAGRQGAGAAGAAGPVGQERADAGEVSVAKDELAPRDNEARRRAEPSVAAAEPEEEQPAPAALADSPAAPQPRTPADTDDAMNLLGSSIKLIDGRRPVRIEQESAPALEGATATGGLVRVVYQDEEDHEFALEQLKVSFDDAAADQNRNQAADAQKAAAAPAAEREAFLRVTPNDTVISTEADSTVRIRWMDSDGVLLTLIGKDEAYLREMMGRIR